MTADALELCIAAYTLRMPGNIRGRSQGSVLGRSTGSSLELQDFRAYMPGDDVRQIDWNAVARTDQMMIRTRRDEVAPRLEVVLDASASMGVTPEKAEAARQFALLLLRMARADGVAATLVIVDDAVRRVDSALEALAQVAFRGRVPMSGRELRAGALRPCALRVVISDLLFEAEFDRFFRGLGETTGALALIQVLGREDVDPGTAGLCSLEDSESGALLERELSADAIARYRARFEGHLRRVGEGATRARAAWCRPSPGAPMAETCRAALLGKVLEVRS